MSDSITVRVLRPIHSRGERVAAGTTLKLPALAAADAVDTGRCELTHAPDKALLQAAVRADVAAMLRHERQRPAAGPWQPMSY